MKTCNFFKIGIKVPKIHCVLEFNGSHWLKPYVEFNTQKKKIEAEKMVQRWKRIVQINEPCFLR